MVLFMLMLVVGAGVEGGEVGEGECDVREGEGEDGDEDGGH